MNELEECFYALHRQADLVRRVTETLKTLQSERDEARAEVEGLRALLIEARDYVRAFHEAGCPADQCEQCAQSDEMMRRIDAAVQAKP